eukprot:3284077-Rhodomonas_salina.1
MRSNPRLPPSLRPELLRHYQVALSPTHILPISYAHLTYLLHACGTKRGYTKRGVWSDGYGGSMLGYGAMLSPTPRVGYYNMFGTKRRYDTTGMFVLSEGMVLQEGGHFSRINIEEDK